MLRLADLANITGQSCKPASEMLWYPLAVAVLHHKTEQQIPTEFSALWEEMRDSDAISIENVSHWNMNSKRMEAQAREGDILITLGGSEGVLYLANLYHEVGKPVIPLNFALTGENEGSLRLFNLALASAQSGRFFRVTKLEPPYLGEPDQLAEVKASRDACSVSA